jgi:hypothetical protein
VVDPVLGAWVGELSSGSAELGRRRETHGETKRQDLIFGGPTKSFLDEAVQALGTEVEPTIS